MKEEIKQFLKENWKTAASIIGAAILLAISYIFEGCGSTWKISGNTVNVSNKCQNDTTTHHNDTIHHEIRQIP
nr:MAG TPA: hypothetical protein [Microviridae sp.]